MPHAQHRLGNWSGAEQYAKLVVLTSYAPAQQDIWYTAKVFEVMCCHRLPILCLKQQLLCKLSAN